MHILPYGLNQYTDLNIGMGCHFLLQGVFPTQGLNPSPLHCRQILYRLSHQESPLNHLWITDNTKNDVNMK